MSQETGRQSPFADLGDFVPKRKPSPVNKDEVRQVSEAENFRSREPQPAAPVVRRRPRRTGRNIQINIKVDQTTAEKFYRLADRGGWVLGAALEHALDALEREMAKGEQPNASRSQNGSQG